MATDKERRAQHRHQHKQRVIRGAPEELWADLDLVTKAAGTDRSAVTRQFWEWYVRRPGADLPKRPAQRPDPDRLTVDDVLQITLGKKSVDDLTDKQRQALEAVQRDPIPERPASSEEKNA